MSFLKSIGWVLVAAGLFAGCTKPASSTPPQVPAEPRQAQPKLQTMKFWLGAEEMVTELALNQSQWQVGMMFRTNMAENEAMIFVFPAPYRASFWMKNTLLPLSAAYIDPDGVILEIYDLQPHDTNAVWASSGRVQFVLETTQGWFGRHNVSTGVVVRTERGTLAETFLRRR